MAADTTKKLKELELLLKDIKLEKRNYYNLKERFLKLQADRKFSSQDKYRPFDPNRLHFDYFG